MAESVDSMHFAANSKINSPKALTAKRSPESRPQSSSDIFPAAAKKARLEERAPKPGGLNGELSAGEKHNGKQSSGSPAKWSFGPAKTSHSVASLPGTPARKIFKISNFLASPHKVKKSKEKRHKDKEKSSEARRSPGPASCRTKTENGDVKPLQRDDPPKDTDRERKKDKEWKNHKLPSIHDMGRENGDIKSPVKESKEKSKSGSEEDLLLKKLKKKKKKKHKDGERAKDRHSRPKMYHRSCQTICTGALPDFLNKLNGNSSLLNTPQQHQDTNCSSTPTAALDRLAYSSPLHCTSSQGLPGLEFGRLIHVEQQANGGASVLHAYSDQLCSLTAAEMERFADEFVTLSFSEDKAHAACFVMGIIHGAAAYLPDFLEYFSYKFPNAPVKMEVLGKKDIETTTMVNFHTQDLQHSIKPELRPERTSVSFPLSSPLNSYMLGAEVDLQQVDNSLFALETLLKAWLQEQGGDREHLHLLLPSPGDSPVCVKCDMQERLISPALIPLTPNLGVKTEATRDFSADKSSVPQRLKAIKVLRADGLCESVLYGLPLLLRPTSCWTLDWDEMESNHILFQALCHSLRSQDLFLLLQSESQRPTPGGAGGVCSYYVLQPSSSLSLLLKPLVSRELLLPCSMPGCTQEPSPEAQQTIQACLGQLDEEFVFNPLLLSSNLYLHLRSRGLLSQPRYPYKAQRNQGQPPEGAKSTGSRQPRQLQGRQSGANSKMRATVAPLPPSSTSALGPPPAKASRPALTLLSSSQGSNPRAPAPSTSAKTSLSGCGQSEDEDSLAFV